MSVEPRQFTCPDPDCDVSWHGVTSICWACGRDAAAAPARKPFAGAMDAFAQRFPVTADGTPLTRWGPNVHEAHARGLADPRAAHLSGT